MQQQEEFQAIHRGYGTRVIDLCHPKFPNVELEWLLYSPDINCYDYFLWDCINPPQLHWLESTHRSTFSLNIKQSQASNGTLVAIYLKFKVSPIRTEHQLFLGYRTRYPNNFFGTLTMLLFPGKYFLIFQNIDVLNGKI